MQALLKKERQRIAELLRGAAQPNTSPPNKATFVRCKEALASQFAGEN